MQDQKTSTFIFYTPGSEEDAKINLVVFNSLLEGRSISTEDWGVINALSLSVAQHGKFPFQWTPQEDAFIKNNDSSKWVDYLIYRFKFKIYPIIKRVSEFPVYLLIEPASACNLRCTMCFQVDKTFTKKPYMGLMDMDLYRRLIDEAVEGGTKAITLASRGEPTLHPRLGEMLEYASHGKFIDLKLNTNATKLTDELCRAILRSDVNELVFSIDAHEKPVYESIRVRGKFDEVLDNVIRFHQIRRDEFPLSKLQTRVSGVKFRPDQDREGFVDFWSKIVDHVGYVDIEARWNTYDNPKHPERSHPCEYLWERAYIWFNGICNPCDVDYKSLLTVGNISEMSIRDMWHSKAYDELRRAHISGERDKFNPCDRCGI
jgi:hypothetical protein